MATKKYQGRDVTVMRDAQQGDQGFDANVKDQVLINDGGQQKVVKRSDLT